MGGRNPLGRVARFVHPSPFFTAREKKTLTTPERLTALMPVASSRDTECYFQVPTMWYAACRLTALVPLVALTAYHVGAVVGVPLVACVAQNEPLPPTTLTVPTVSDLSAKGNPSPPRIELSYQTLPNAVPPVARTVSLPSMTQVPSGYLHQNHPSE